MIQPQKYYMFTQKAQVTSAHRLSLPSQQKRKQVDSFWQHKLLNKSLHSPSKLAKPASLIEAVAQNQSKKSNLVRLPFNFFKQKLAQYLATNEAHLQAENRHKYKQIANVSAVKPQNYKTQLFRSYKKKKIQSRHQLQNQTFELDREFNVKEISIMDRQCLQKEQTMPSIAVKRECLRYFGQNKCFERSLHLRQKQSSPQLLQIPVKNQQKLKEKPAANPSNSVQIPVKIQQKSKQKSAVNTLSYSVDVENMKVQPWIQEKQSRLERDYFQSQDTQ